jgi:hypothetical protein
MAKNANHTMTKVHELLRKTREQKETRISTGPQIAFLPEGSHKIRWFFDPNGDIYRELMTGRFGKHRFVCPDFMARRDKEHEYPTCEADAKADETDNWRVRCRYNCMVYGYLHETKQPGEYWKPNQVYVIIGNSRLRKALLEMLEALAEEEEDMLLGMLTPSLKGYYTTTSVSRGAQGNVSIQLLPKAVDPIELGEWYRPLSEVWIDSAFNVDEYTKAMTVMKEEETSTPAEEDDTSQADADTIVIENTEDDTPASAVVDALLEDIENEVTSARNETSLEASDEDSEAGVAEKKKVSRKTAKGKSETQTSKTGYPDFVVLENVPDECPGWSQYKPTNPPCLMCEYNIPCLNAARSTTVED